MCPGCGDLDQAEHWTKYSLSLRPDHDRTGRAKNLINLSYIALHRFDDALAAAGEAQPEHINAALRHAQQALDTTPADDLEDRASLEHQLGRIYSRTTDTSQALRHYQQAIQHDEARGNIYDAGITRYDIAELLANNGRISDAVHYARAALHNFQQVGPGAATNTAGAEQLIAILEQRGRRQLNFPFVYANGCTQGWYNSRTVFQRLG